MGTNNNDIMKSGCQLSYDQGFQENVCFLNGDTNRTKLLGKNKLIEKEDSMFVEAPGEYENGYEPKFDIVELEEFRELITEKTTRGAVYFKNSTNPLYTEVKNTKNSVIDLYTVSTLKDVDPHLRKNYPRIFIVLTKASSYNNEEDSLKASLSGNEICFFLQYSPNRTTFVMLSEEESGKTIDEWIKKVKTPAQFPNGNSFTIAYKKSF